jgi:hypothetical protein
LTFPTTACGFTDSTFVFPKGPRQGGEGVANKLTVYSLSLDVAKIGVKKEIAFHYICHIVYYICSQTKRMRNVSVRVADYS